MPSQVGHIPCGVLKEKKKLAPTSGVPSRDHTSRIRLLTSVAVPTVLRELAPMRSWSTTMAADRFSSVSTSGRAGEAMNDWTNAG